MERGRMSTALEAQECQIRLQSAAVKSQRVQQTAGVGEITGAGLK